MKPTQLLNASLFFKAASAMDPTITEMEPPESKFLKRRRLMARVLPALLLGLYGGFAGHSIGRMRDTGNEMMGGEPTNNATKDMLLGGLGGAAIGYGGGALRSNMREWAGADPMLNTVAMGRA